jgi:hypothetical protein
VLLLVLLLVVVLLVLFSLWLLLRFAIVQLLYSQALAEGKAASAEKQLAQELLGLEGCIQRVTALQARLLTPDGNRDFVNMNFSLWEALFAELQSVPNLTVTGLADKKAEVLPRVEMLQLWERELRAREVQKRSELQLRVVMLTVPALVAVGIEQEAAQRICSFA